MKNTIYRSIGIIVVIALLLAIPAAAFFAESEISDNDHETHTHDRGVVAGVDYPANCPYCQAGTGLWSGTFKMCPGGHGSCARYHVKCMNNHSLGYVYNCAYCFGLFPN